jgi:hypothetical protein
MNNIFIVVSASNKLMLSFCATEWTAKTIWAPRRHLKHTRACRSTCSGYINAHVQMPLLNDVCEAQSVSKRPFARGALIARPASTTVGMPVHSLRRAQTSKPIRSIQACSSSACHVVSCWLAHLGTKQLQQDAQRFRRVPCIRRQDA